jgi:hypothetical protein
VAVIATDTHSYRFLAKGKHLKLVLRQEYASVIIRV